MVAVGGDEGWCKGVEKEVEGSNTRGPVKHIRGIHDLVVVISNSSLPFDYKSSS